MDGGNNELFGMIGCMQTFFQRGPNLGYGQKREGGGGVEAYVRCYTLHFLEGENAPPSPPLKYSTDMIDGVHKLIAGRPLKRDHLYTSLPVVAILWQTFCSCGSLTLALSVYYLVYSYYGQVYKYIIMAVPFSTPYSTICYTLDFVSSVPVSLLIVAVMKGCGPSILLFILAISWTTKILFS